MTKAAILAESNHDYNHQFYGNSLVLNKKNEALEKSVKIVFRLEKEDEVYLTDKMLRVFNGFLNLNKSQVREIEKFIEEAYIENGGDIEEVSSILERAKIEHIQISDEDDSLENDFYCICYQVNELEESLNIIIILL